MAKRYDIAKVKETDVLEVDINEVQDMIKCYLTDEGRMYIYDLNGKPVPITDIKFVNMADPNDLLKPEYPNKKIYININRANVKAYFKYNGRVEPFMGNLDSALQVLKTTVIANSKDIVNMANIAKELQKSLYVKTFRNVFDFGKINVGRVSDSSIYCSGYLMKENQTLNLTHIEATLLAEGALNPNTALGLKISYKYNASSTKIADIVLNAENDFSVKIDIPNNEYINFHEEGFIDIEVTTATEVEITDRVKITYDFLRQEDYTPFELNTEDSDKNTNNSDDSGNVLQSGIPSSDVERIEPTPSLYMK